MQAANHGAFDNDGVSVGLRVDSPNEEELNPYVNLPYTFANVPQRKQCLLESSICYVFYPGGYGTLDELMQTLAIQQISHQKVDVWLYNKQFWGNFDQLIRESLFTYKMISPEDLKLYAITDDIDQIIDCL
jgi:uncharacterized protein (TIGR00730 family)